MGLKKNLKKSKLRGVKEKGNLLRFGSISWEYQPKEKPQGLRAQKKN